MNQAKEFWADNVMPSIRSTNDGAWYTKPVAWIVILVMVLLGAAFFIAILLSESKLPATNDKKFKKADEKLEDAQAQLVREIAEVDDEIERNDKEGEETVAAIDSADDDELLSIYNGLRAEHSGRNAAGDEN